SGKRRGEARRWTFRVRNHTSRGCAPPVHLPSGCTWRSRYATKCPMLDTKSIYEALSTLDSEQALADAAHREALVNVAASGGKGFLKALRSYVKSNDARNKKRQRLLAQLEKAETKAKAQKK